MRTFFRFFLLRLRQLLFGVSFNARPYNFGVVKENCIYRSSQPGKLFLQSLIKNYQIKTVINLANKTDPLEGLKIFHFALPVRSEPPEPIIQKILDLINQPEHWPILIHCIEGADRTGLLVALRRLREKWDLAEIKKEMLYYHYIP